jgi:hypothetical protein
VLTVLPGTVGTTWLNSAALVPATSAPISTTLAPDTGAAVGVPSLVVADTVVAVEAVPLTGFRLAAVAVALSVSAIVVAVGAKVLET